MRRHTHAHAAAQRQQRTGDVIEARATVNASALASHDTHIEYRSICLCAGVAHLAEQLLVHLRDTQPELNITPHDIELVKMAGLCHDLGHGPFSHMFEEFVHTVNPNSEFRHERMSLQMLERIIKTVSAQRQTRNASSRIAVSAVDRTHRALLTSPSERTQNRIPMSPKDMQFLREFINPYDNPRSISLPPSQQQRTNNTIIS